MNNQEDIRWQQRFSNYEKALGLLVALSETKPFSAIEQAAFIQYFEMTIELGWKVLKDWLEFNKLSFTPTPREVVKLAFQIQIIKDGGLWLEALDERNRTVHTYDVEKANAVEFKIREKFLPLFLDLQHELSTRLS
jgi:nucleotidyltransferase substrate binding protein (TIGR01987 family)